jgi:hypothetical protein
LPYQTRIAFRIGLLAGGLLLVVLAAGCGNKGIYPVSGQLVDPDGKPITGMKGGAVELEGVDVKASANGSIDEEGRFRITTEKPGDGAHLGKHKVAITRPYYGPEQPAPHVIQPKYESLETSGLEITVEPRSNVIKLTVEPVQGRKR